jgi:AcrR family transcriptional regulator
MNLEKLIDESLQELAAQKPIDDITVQMIVDNAQISKASFYNYYLNKGQLVSNNAQKVLPRFAECPKPNWITYLNSLYMVMSEKKAFFASVAGCQFSEDTINGNAAFFKLQLNKALEEKKIDLNLPENAESIFNYAEFLAHFIRDFAIGKEPWDSQEQVVKIMVANIPVSIARYLK